MINRPMTQRTATGVVAGMTVAAALTIGSGWSAETSVTVGLDISLTGADAEFVRRIEYGALMAFDKVNGDLEDKTISVFQVKQDKSLPPDDLRQYHYIGVASST